MSAIRPISLFAMVTLLGTLAACAGSPAAHTSDPPAASTGDTKGDAANGKAVFMSSCTTCHSVTKDDPSTTMVGPNLFGVVGRQAGTVKSLLGPSENLKKYGVTWSTETLDEFLANPLAKLPFDTPMLGRLPDAKQRADVVAYLASLKP